MVYIPSNSNTIANALSRLPPDMHITKLALLAHVAWSTLVSAVLSIAVNKEVLTKIKASYSKDVFCVQLALKALSDRSIKQKDGLWYIHDHLVIPHTGSIHQNLFHMAHNATGHFVGPKAYALLRDSYFWPNMQ
jgi:hypothetical protein